MNASALMTGCASLGPPSADRIASLPLVTFPEPPTTEDFVLKLPAGQPIPTNVSITGIARPPRRVEHGPKLTRPTPEITLPSPHPRGRSDSSRPLAVHRATIPRTAAPDAG